MLKSYLLTALRNLLAQRLHSAINIAGLSIGLASFVLIGLFVRYELGYDGFFANADRIYRISRDYYATGGAPDRVPASANAPIAPALLEDFPEIDAVARIFGGGALLERGDLVYLEAGFRWADGALFEIFDFEWLAGDPATALAEPRSIVLTERLARKYFRDLDPVGQTLIADHNAPLTVTGVIADLPQNTHLDFDALGSLTTLAALFGPEMLERWNALTDFHTYFLLREGVPIESIESRIPAFIERRIAPDATASSGMTVMNIRDIHNRSTRDEEWKPAGNLTIVYGFAAIALLILTIACINFMNLATARAAKRAKEVGVRKALGAARRELVVQFLGESVLTAVIAMLVAAVAVELLLPSYGAFIERPLELTYFGAGGVAPWLAGIAVLVGLVAGSYPAFYLSAFNPERVLKGDVHRLGGTAFRNVLVTAQFAIAIALLIGTAVVHRQTSFARDLDLGFNKEQIVLLTAPPQFGLGPQWQALRQELSAAPGVRAVTASHYPPFAFDDNHFTVRPRGSAGIRRIQYMAVDYDFFETYEIDMVSGRSFSRDFSTDAMGAPDNPFGRRGAFVLNESAARLLGWSPQEAVGATVELGLDETFMAVLPLPVIGVARDTHFQSVEVPVRPLIFVLTPEPVPPINRLDSAAIRIAAGDPTRTLERIDAAWREFVPQLPVSRHFLDEDFDALYRSHARQAQMLSYFSALAVAVACLGLLGLAWFTTERRTKEIGIRKVIGGTVWDVVGLFTAEFSKLVLIANLIAWPVAYFVAQQWLAGFAYRIELGLLPFVGAALLALLVACATVGAVAARAAAAKPLQALRYE
jgi:putative ABC transport system permease protein